MDAARRARGVSVFARELRGLGRNPQAVKKSSRRPENIEPKRGSERPTNVRGGHCPGPIRSGAPMSAHTYAYTLKPSGPTGVRSFAIIAAAIMAVGVLSSVPVMRELVGSAPARATTAVTAPSSDFQSRWWPGETQQATRRVSTMPERQASTVPESDLTFAKGYSLRLAARKAASATGPVATAPSSE